MWSLLVYGELFEWEIRVSTKKTMTFVVVLAVNWHGELQVIP